MSHILVIFSLCLDKRYEVMILNQPLDIAIWDFSLK